MKNIAPYSQAPFEQALLQLITANTPDFIAVLKETDFSIVYINGPGARLFGYKNPKSLINKSMPFKRTHPLLPSRLKKIKQIVTRQKIFIEEVEYIDKNGTPFWGRLQVNPFKAGKEKFYLIQIEKIDRAKFAEDKLIREKQRFGALLDYASIAVVIVNRQQKIILMNPSALKLFGYKISEVKDKHIEILIPPKFRRQHRLYHQEYYKHPGNRPMGIGRELSARKKDGTIIPVEISLGTYKTEEDVYAIAYITDISLRKQKEDEIKKLNMELEGKIQQRTDELAVIIHKLEQQVKETEEKETLLKQSLEKEKELSQLKSRFVSIASHEFRTPLSTILSSAYLLQKYVNTDEQEKRDRHIERITSSVNMLTDILNDFLSVGKIEEGRVTPNYILMGINEKTEEVINEIKMTAKPGQQITCNSNVTKKVWMDASIFKHILINLLSNAIKFSAEKSKIEVDIQQRGRLLKLTVKDNGIGISKDDQQHLFERFYRGANAANIQGTGLGLHIVKKYVELMNGTIECRSELEKGASFIITFRLKNKAA